MMDMGARLVECVHLDDQHVVMALEAPEIAESALPGQFVMIGVSEGTDPLLRRPFGIMDASPPLVHVYFQVVGAGTRILADRRPGDRIPVLGPLGKGFPDACGRSILAVAGGRGIAPLVFALKHYRRNNHVSLLYGSRCAALLHLRDRIDKLGLDATNFCTECGDFGNRGLVTDTLTDMLATSGADMTISCGPHAMLAELATRLEKGATEDYMSAEALMGCGFGACHSCVIPAAAGGYLRVCKDGPVFSRREVLWRT
ncbi:MAG TPA: dihydroorotate dehydrogenase electron transfer subunit [Candidatus Aminicenantes bacterium]|nr:dihydroorotate dehydrogenase electron transfer subunit [Candidatus Aminicenantes bacterium]